MRSNEKGTLFKRYNGITEKLYLEKQYLYLKAENDNFCFDYAKDIEVSVMQSVGGFHPKKLILDLECISKVDSAAVGVLIYLYSECKKIDCEMILVNVNPTILKIFNLLKITEFFRILESLENL